MVKLKNNSFQIQLFGLLLTFFWLVSCSDQNYRITRIEGKKISIDQTQNTLGAASAKMESFIKPYRDHIDRDLSEVLAYSPETLDKSKGEWQTNIGVFLADITLETTTPILLKREGKKIDICLLNHGGIRAVIPKGNVTTRTAYEVMPFENSAIVIGLKAEQLLEIANYIIAEKKPHPLAGMTFTIGRDNQAKNILIQGKPIDHSRVYYVVTSDYLSNGGDNMIFFKKGTEQFDLDYKLRNILIDYFRKADTLKVSNGIRIAKE